MRDGSEFESRVEVAETYEVILGGRLLETRSGRGSRSGKIARAPAIVPVLLCDHADNALPEAYGTLGLPPGQLERHIAYDIGAAGVVRRSQSLLDAASRHGAVAVLSRYSRLLVDLNRGADDPTLIMRLSDGAVVPGNHPIDQAEWDRRIALYYTPYHRAIDRVLDDLTASGLIPILVSVHSFTPSWKDFARPWHAGILWDRDDRLPVRLLDALRSDPALVVGDNEPYSGRLEGDCLNQHATRRGLANALVEIRQDLIAADDGQLAWAQRLSTILLDLLSGADAASALRPLREIAHMNEAAAADACRRTA